MDTLSTLDPEKERSLKTVGVVSYVLHLIVAIAAVIPGLNASIALLLVALIIDFVKKDDAVGTWQESHFRWRLYRHHPAVAAAGHPGLDRLVRDLHLVPVPHRPRLHEHERQQADPDRLIGCASTQQHTKNTDRRVIMEGIQSDGAASESNVRVTHIIYGLYALGFLTGVTWLVAIVMNYVKRDDVRGTMLESHFEWQIKTFWYSLAASVIAFLLFITIIGALLAIPLWIATTIWVIYRIVKGWLALNDNKPINT
jgi:uncharacterized membrane protein